MELFLEVYMLLSNTYIMLHKSNNASWNLIIKEVNQF